MSVSKATGPLMINGQALDLTHLAMISREVNLDLPGGFTKKVKAIFQFSCHCFSRSPDEQVDGTLEQIPPHLFVADGSAKQPRNRIFCPRRYELSKQIVSVIDAMISTNADVTATVHINYFHCTSLSHAIVDLPNPASYYMFFRVKKTKPPNSAAQLEISVESAYTDANAGGGATSKLSVALGKKWAAQ